MRDDVVASETVDLGGLADGLARLGAPIADWSPVLQKLAVYLPSVSKRAIQQQTSPSGLPFAPLKPATLRGRRKGGKGAKALYDTGLMLGAFTGVPDGPVSLLWGNGVNYWRWHQTGTRHMPARKTVEAAPQVVDVITSMVADHAAKEIAKRSLGQ